jgi:hypothetical protein
MRQPTKTRVTSEAAPDAGSDSPDERTWLQQYREHLGRLYEPPTDLPPDLDQLVKALTGRAGG